MAELASQSNREISIAEALTMWHSAQEYFENVSDPDLIEYAIYDLETAKRRYMYLLKRVRIKEDTCEHEKCDIEDRNAL